MLSKLWFAIATDKSRSAGTKSSLVLIVSNRHFDLLHHTLEPTDVQEEGETSLYYFDFSKVGIEAYPYDTFIRIGIRGDDAWRPKHVVVWAEEADTQRIYPLAVDTNMYVRLSGDANEGPISTPIRQVYSGGGYSNIGRLMMIVTTADTRHAGTKSQIELEIEDHDSLVGEIIIPDSGDSLEQAQASIHIMEVNEMFEPRTMRSIILKMKGDDAWLPQSLFLFGLEGREGRPNYAVPLVHIPDWKAADLGWISGDKSEGDPEVKLFLSFGNPMS